MAPKSGRRTSGGPTARKSKPTKQQSTLAFHGQSSKITKPSAQPLSNKANKDPALLTESVVSTDDVKVEADPDIEQEPTTAEISIIEQAESEAKVPLTPEEEDASRVSEAQINRYWKEKEQSRKAPRVHQAELGIHEKVCREWDTDGRYGVSFFRFQSCTFSVGVEEIRRIADLDCVAVYGHCEDKALEEGE
jgi:DNA polymerase delta subunit 4